MSLRAIHAIFECDGCACQFGAEIDTATKRPLKWSLMDIAEDALRGGFGWITHGPHTREEGVCSLQGGKHLCPPCTRAEDAKHDDMCTCDECNVDRNRPRVEAGGCWVKPEVVEKLGLRQPGESVQSYMLRKGIRP